MGWGGVGEHTHDLENNAKMLEKTKTIMVYMAQHIHCHIAPNSCCSTAAAIMSNVAMIMKIEGTAVHHVQ